MGAPALAGAPQPDGGGAVCSPTRGPGLAPTRDPAAADAVFPNRARDTRQRVAHPASGTAAPAPSLARSQRRVQPEGFQGALELGGCTPRHEGAGGSSEAHKAQPPPSAVEFTGTHGIPPRVCRLGSAGRLCGESGCVCGVQGSAGGCARAGRARIDVQPHACLRRGVPWPAPWACAGPTGVPGALGAAAAVGVSWRTLCGKGWAEGQGGHPVQPPPPTGPWVLGHTCQVTPTLPPQWAQCWRCGSLHTGSTGMSAAWQQCRGLGRAGGQWGEEPGWGTGGVNHPDTWAGQ